MRSLSCDSCLAAGFQPFDPFDGLPLMRAPVRSLLLDCKRDNNASVALGKESTEAFLFRSLPGSCRSLAHHGTAFGAN